MTLLQVHRFRTHRRAAGLAGVAGGAGVIVLATLLSPSTAAAASSFRGLGVLPGPSPEEVEPYDISDDGTVVVGALRAPGSIEAEAFRWTATSGFVRLGNLGGAYPYSAGVGISADGSVIVGSSLSPSSGGWEEPMRWAENTGMVGLGNLKGGLFDGLATAASADGSVIVGRSSSTLAPNTFGEAFRWTAATGMVGLGVLTQSGFVYSMGWGVSDDGTVVVGTAATALGHEAFRWTAVAGMVPLGDLPGTPYPVSHALDVSSDGSVIAGYSMGSSSPARAFRWTAADGMVDLGGPPGARDNFAWSLSADGSVVVGHSYVGSDAVATIWDAAHGMRDLTEAMAEAGLSQAIEGWDFESAAAVAADNLTVVGWGYNPAGEREAFLANLGPPSIAQIPTVSGTALAVFAALLMAAALQNLRLRQGPTNHRVHSWRAP